MIYKILILLFASYFIDGQIVNETDSSKYKSENIACITGPVPSSVKDGESVYMLVHGNFLYGEGNKNIDTCIVKDRHITFLKKIEGENTMAFINLGNHSYTFYLEPGYFTIDTLNKVIVGSDMNTILSNVDKEVEKAKSIEDYQKLIPYMKMCRGTQLEEYIANIMISSTGASNDPINADKVLDSMSGRKLTYGPLIGAVMKVDEVRQTMPGSKYCDFEGETVTGDKVSLSDYVGKGKYVLMDFWASWCGWCRAEFPNLSETYAKFKGDNFEIVGVAVSDKKAATLKALEEETLCTWPQIINVGRAPMNLYGVTGIPQIILISPNGDIVARNLRGEKLQKIVESALKGELDNIKNPFNYTVKGIIPETLKPVIERTGVVTLVNASSKRELGSCKVDKDKMEYQFNGVVEGRDSVVMLQIGANRVPFVLEPGVIEFKQWGIPSGTPLNDELNKADEECSKNFVELNSLQERLNKKKKMSDTEKNDSLVKEYKKALAKNNEIYIKYMKSNLDNPVNAILFQKIVDGANYDDIATYDRAWSCVGEFTKNYPAAISINKRMEHKRNVQKGMMFSDFTIENGNYPDGGPVKFSDYIGKGKYVLVDFWASWCGPCRGEIPNIKKVYEKYAGDKFDCLSVAVWDKHDKTVEAIIKEQMPWPQIINCENIPTEIYGINGIPQIMLFGPDGTILESGLRGDNIMQKLQEIFKY